MNKSAQNKNILISGAGIAGQALAYWLVRYGFNVTIVEKAAGIRKGGYRVDLRGAAVEVAKRMGIREIIKASNTAMRGSSFINADGKWIADINDPNIFGMRNENDIEIMRGDLADILYQQVKEKVNYIFDESISSIEQTEHNVTVTFNSGATQTYDLLIGADGLHSSVRKLAFNEEKEVVKQLGYYICVFSIPNYLELDHWELAYSTAGKIINVYSTHQRQEAKALFLFKAPATNFDDRNINQQKKMVSDAYKDEGDMAATLLAYMDQSKDFYCDSMSQIRMAHLYKGRIVLLGDAGYCASPASGQGTSLSLTGAYVLAGNLAEAQGNYNKAFAAYEQDMRPYIDINQQLANTVLKEMIPSSRMQAKLQSGMIQVLLKLPWKERIIKSFVKKMQDTVNHAANAIELKDYD